MADFGIGSIDSGKTPRPSTYTPRALFPHSVKARAALMGLDPVSAPQASTEIEVVPVVTNGGVYGASKVVGGVITFENILPPAPNSALLESITLKFKASVQTASFYVLLFSDVPTGTFTDGATAAIAAADTASLIGAYSLLSPVSVAGTHTIYELNALVKAIQGSTQNVYAVVIAGAALTALASTSDMSLTVGVVQG